MVVPLFFIKQYSSDNDNCLYTLHKNGKASYTLKCMLPSNEQKILKVNGELFTGKSEFFRTQIYGDNASKFMEEEPNCITLHITQNQFLVLTSIIIPYFYNQTITISNGEPFIHTFSFAKYFQMTELLRLLEKKKDEFLSFSLLYKICCIYTEQYPTVTIKPDDFFAEGDVTMINIAESKLKTIFDELHMEALLDFPFEAIEKLLLTTIDAKLLQNFFLFGFHFAEYISSGSHPFYSVDFAVPQTYWNKFDIWLLKNIPIALIQIHNLKFSTILKMSKQLSIIPNQFAIFLIKYIDTLLQSNTIGLEQCITLFQCIDFDKINKDGFATLCYATPFVSKETTLHIIKLLLNNCGVKFISKATSYLILVFGTLQERFADFKDDWYDLLIEIPLPLARLLYVEFGKTMDDAALFLLNYRDAKHTDGVLDTELELAWNEFDCSLLSVTNLSRIAQSSDVPIIVRNKCIDILAKRVDENQTSIKMEKRIILKNFNVETFTLKEPMKSFVQECHDLATGKLRLRDADVNYKLDEEVIEYVCVNNIKQMRYLNSQMLNNKDLMLKLVSKNPNCVQYVSFKLQQDEDILIAASADSGALKLIKYVDKLFEREMILKICKSNIKYFDFYKESNIVDISILQSIQKEAYDYFMQKKESKDARIYLNIGKCYTFGYLVPIYKVIANDWYLKSASLGNAYAMHNIGCSYDTIGIPEQNYTKALDWYKKAAEAGCINAITNIGCLYDKGKGVSMNLKTARMYHSKGARMGDKIAAKNLKNLEICGEEKKSKTAVKK